MKDMNVHAGTSSKDEWLTPPKIVKSLGEFDLDPCSPINRPWDTAKNHFSILDNGLIKEWFGRIWLNPPYGGQLIHWLNKLSLHGDGLALTFARTDTNAFHHYVFNAADSIFFFKQRLKFCNVDGKPSYSGIAPSVLIAYGGFNSEAINDANLNGVHLPINRIGITILGFDATWKSVVKTVFIRLNRPADLNEIYAEVEKIAPEKVAKNKHFQAKIRQTVQMHFQKIKRGTYDKH
jgi:hypothetical protein